MLRAVARRARLPAASLALGGATLAAYTHGSDEEYRRISEETLPLKCERPATQAVDPHAAARERGRRHRAPVEQLDLEGNTALLHACTAGEPEGVQALLAARASAARTNRTGRDALCCAAVGGRSLGGASHGQTMAACVSRDIVRAVMPAAGEHGKGGDGK